MGLMTCVHCGKLVTESRGRWWSDDDDFMCSDGLAQHSVEEQRMDVPPAPPARDNGRPDSAHVRGRDRPASRRD